MCLLFLTGCASPVTKRAGEAISGWWKGSAAVEEPAADPFTEAAHTFTRYGVILIAGGLIFGAFTRFSTGWGTSAAAAGFLMIVLAWTFRQVWVPWVSLGTILAYGGYKIYNRLNPHLETEPLLK